MIYIRMATSNDLPIVQSLVKSGFEEMGGDFGIDYEHLSEGIAESIKEAPTFIVFKDDIPIGVASLNICNVIWSKKHILTSNMVHVLKEYRNFAIIKQLYKAIREYADLEGILYLDIFHGEGVLESRIRLAEATGLRQLGISIYYKG